MIQYEDFSIKLEPKWEDVYPVIVLRSPAGEGRSAFHLPFNPAEVGDILVALGETVRGGFRPTTRSGSEAATRTPPQQVGDQLFRALFAGRVRSLLDRSLALTEERQHGLRIKLHIDPEDPDLAQLASLPWEFLYQKETRDFLNLSRYTPIVRYLDVQRSCVPLALEPPLRILVAMPSPADYPVLNLNRERKLIKESWAKLTSVQVEFLEDATIQSLQNRLVAHPYHVLHYMGHGDFDESTGNGTLVMEDEFGDGDLVDGRRLGILLRDSPSMRLAFLNACETARMTQDKGFDPFAGVATAMVISGIPAVVAMQFPISDDAAITFARQFYSLLASGYPVDAAVAEGRRAIRLDKNETMEWGTPVLFMRAPQGIIFQVTDGMPAGPQVPEKEVEVQESEKIKADAFSSWRDWPWWSWALIGIAIVALLAALVSGISWLNGPEPASDATATAETRATEQAVAAATEEIQRTEAVTLSPPIETEEPAPAPIATDTPTPSRTPTKTPSLTPTYRPGEARAFPLPDGESVTMVWIPAGEFIMGSSDTDIDAILASCSDCQRDWFNDEQPQHTVYLDAFWIDQTEVTNAQFAAFAAATGYQTAAERRGGGYVDTRFWGEYIEGADWQHPEGPESDLSGLGNHPVALVTWDDAVAFCEWRDARLPTEAEWEKAARGDDGRTYPWGEGISCNQANYWVNEDSNGCVGGTTAVGSYSPNSDSPYGAMDMTGNVWEWVADWFDADYYSSPEANENPDGPPSSNFRLLRGGSWRSYGRDARAADRYGELPSLISSNIGIRCVSDPSP